MHFPHPAEIAARRKKIGAMVAGLVLVCGVAVYLCRSDEPSYHGHSLSYWLEDTVNPLAHLQQYGDPQSLDFTHESLECKKAVETIGTNAIPTLLKYVQVKGDSGFSTLFVLLARSRAGLAPRLPGGMEKHMMAMMGFAMLGTNALPAVPALAELTKNEDPTVRIWAVKCLIAIQSLDRNELLPVLIQFGHDPDPANRQEALRHMQLVLMSLKPAEAEKAGVFDAFPELKSMPAVPAQATPNLL